MSEIKNKEYKYKQNVIELVINNKGSLEISDEALRLLSSLKNQKLIVLSINGLPNSGKTELANYLVKKDKAFDSIKNKEGMWIWGTPIDIKNDIKLLVIFCEGIKDNKINNYNILSLLFSSHFIFNTKGEINDNIINNYINNINIKDFLNVKKNNYLSEIVFINDLLSKEEIKNKVENNPLYTNKNIKSLFTRQKYLQSNNLKELINIIDLNNIYLNGDILLGLIQNYINYVNHDEKIDIDTAIESVLLYKAKLECDNIFEEYKSELYKKIEYPMTFTNIFKIYCEIETNYINSFCKKLDNLLTPTQIGEYINQLNNYMEKEINYIINKNNEYYENFFLLQFKDLEKTLKTNDDLENIENFHKFIVDYCGKFDNCLQKFFSTLLNSDNSNKSFVNILIKLYQEYIFNKFINISEKINKIYDERNNKYIEEINSLKNNLNKINEQMNNTNLLIEEKNKEKSIINKNYFELETKFDKFNREYKIKIKEYENNINIEIQKFKKMENYYISQLKEKEKLINDLENKIEKNNQDLQNINKENTMKLNEFNRENNRLLNEIERIKDIKKNKSDFMGGDKNANIPSLLKTVNKSFINFKESVDNLIKENDSIQKNKYLEISSQEIENKLNNILNDVKNFCNLQIKNVSNNYEQIIQKIKNEKEEMNFELSKTTFALKEQMKLKETYEKKFSESNKSIDNLKTMVQDKENLINTQKSAFKVYEDRINDSEMKMAENIINLKMKEDEFESLFMIIENIIAKRKDKFEHDLNKISPEAQKFLKTLIKQYKFFK